MAEKKEPTRSDKVVSSVDEPPELSAWWNVLSQAKLLVGMLALGYLELGEGNVSWDGNRHSVTELPVPENRRAGLDDFVRFCSVFDTTDDFMAWYSPMAIHALNTLDLDEQLRVSRDDLGQAAKDASLPGDLTGISIAALMTRGKLRISLDRSQNYIVTYDTALARSIPALRDRVARVLWDLKLNLDDRFFRSLRLSFGARNANRVTDTGKVSPTTISLTKMPPIGGYAEPGEAFNHVVATASTHEREITFDQASHSEAAFKSMALDELGFFPYPEVVDRDDYGYFTGLGGRHKVADARIRRLKVGEEVTLEPVYRTRLDSEPDRMIYGSVLWIKVLSGDGKLLGMLRDGCYYDVVGESDCRQVYDLDLLSCFLSHVRAKVSKAIPPGALYGSSREHPKLVVRLELDGDPKSIAEEAWGLWQSRQEENRAALAQADAEARRKAEDAKRQRAERQKERKQKRAKSSASEAERERRHGEWLVKRLSSAAEKRSAADLKELLDKYGLPAWVKDGEQSPSNTNDSRLLLMLCGYGSDAMRKRGLLVDAGLTTKQPDLQHFLGIKGTKYTCEGTDLPIARECILKLIARGSSFPRYEPRSAYYEGYGRGTGPGGAAWIEVILVFRAFPADVELYEKLEEAGLDFAAAAQHPRQSSPVDEMLESLITDGRYKTLKFALSRGMFTEYAGANPSHWLTIRATWDEAAVDLALSCGIALGDFDADASKDVVAHALEHGVRPRITGEDLWKKVVDNGLVEIGDVLAAQEVAFPEGEFSVRPPDVATLEWAYEAGLRPGIVSADAAKPVLLRAAELGLVPDDPAKISESLDAEVIVAFLDAGAKGLDPSAALEQGREDVVELFRSHGASIRPTRVVDGSAYLEAGVITIPEGVTEVCDGAFRGMNASRIVLPDSLRTIGRNAFMLGRLRPEEVDVPAGVERIGVGAFYGVRRLVFHRPVDLQALGCLEASIPEGNNPRIIWYKPGEGNSGWRWGCYRWPSDLEADYTSWGWSLARDFEVVLESPGGTVARRVWMPLQQMPKYMNNWFCWSSTQTRGVDLGKASDGDDERFYTRYDELFGMIKDKGTLLRMAVCRLAWPVCLSDEARGAYEECVTKSAMPAARLLIDDDDVQALRALEPLGVVTKANVNDLLFWARAGEAAPKCAAYLDESRQALGAKERSDRPGKKPLVWNKKRIDEFQRLADVGDVPAMERYLERVGGGTLPDGKASPFGRSISEVRLRLWLACCRRLDVEMLDLLVSKGFSVPDVVRTDTGAVGNLYQEVEGNALIYDVAPWAVDPTRRAAAERFLDAAISQGVSFEGKPFSYDAFWDYVYSRQKRKLFESGA